MSLHASRAACAAMLVLGATAFHTAPGRPACRPWGGALRACRGAKLRVAGLMAIADTPPRCTRRFEFVPYGQAYAGGEKSICADGLVQGADLHLTHWTNNKTPMKYMADLSTEIVFKWLKIEENMIIKSDGRISKYPSREFLNAVVLNNHFDTDGLMSAWALLEPEKALKYENVMIAAAAAGDFEEWDFSDRGMILDIALKKLAQEAGSEKAAYEQLLPKMEELLMTIPKQPHLWQQELDELERVFDLVCDDVIKVSRLEDNKSKFNHAQGDVGDIGILTHPKGTPCVPGPVISRTFAPVMKSFGKSVGRILLALEQEDGQWMYRYERPRYAWAETVDRPLCAKPNGQRLVEQLAFPWTADVADDGMTAICKTTEPIATGPAEMANELLTFERSILPRLA